jgi:hypothetical protein
MKTSELTGAALDWAVAKCEGVSFTHGDNEYELDGRVFQRGGCSVERRYSTSWDLGGPIIERELIQLSPQSHGKYSGLWAGNKWHTNKRGAFVPGTMYGETPLIAAMRCFVGSKLGDTVDVPEELV